MIKIKVGKPDKLKNNILVKASAFVTFDYNTDIVQFIKSMGTRVYIPETHTWEMPIANIIALCNKFENEEIEITGTYQDLSDKAISETSIPEWFKFKTKPFNHQIDGVKFGLAKKRFLLCDEQGLGKTKQIIDLANCLDDTNKILIVCGVNSLKYNWFEEIKTHSDEKGWILGTRFRKNGNMYEGSSKDKLEDLNNLPDCKFIITNIETLRAGAKKEGRSYTFPIADKIAQLCEDGIISMIATDEVHKMKNPTSLQGRAFLKLNAKYEVAMSGTPLMNNPLDLFVPLHWLGYDSHSFYQFKQHYCNFGGWGGSDVVGYKNLDEIRALLDSIMLRRLKTEVLDLPEKIVSTEYVEMTSKQSVIYKEVLEGTRNELHKMAFSNNPLSMLIRLRQATGYTGILSETVKESCKLDRLEEMIEELSESGQKAIIFSNWSQMTEITKQKLAKYNPAYITGDTKPEERMSEVHRFQNDNKCKVIIGTMGAMGTGLTLTAAQTVIFLDLPWNRAIFDQCCDRAHRIGTKGTVNVVKLICKNTIDEKIDEIVYKKGLMSDAIIDGKGGKIDMKILNELLF